MAGNRDKDWGKEKKFREGQSEQVLDTLFFDFIDLAKELQPKVVVAENVKGLLMGNAKDYVIEIYKSFDEAGYYCQHFLLDASKMGVPQRRERVFFIALRKDLAKPFLHWQDMFTEIPKIEMEFDEKEIPFKEIDDIETKETKVKLYPSYLKCWNDCKEGFGFNTVHHKGMLHNSSKVDRNKVLPTIAAHKDGGSYHWLYPRHLTDKENCFAGTFPQDYNFLNLRSKYIIGMSVPPVMTAQVASNIYDQWLSKL
jgi:DNA (cytosine-5)-methyltransferase 1